MPHFFFPLSWVSTTLVLFFLLVFVMSVISFSTQPITFPSRKVLSKGKGYLFGYSYVTPMS